MQAAASGIEKDFTLLVSSFREGNYLKLITIAEQNPDLLVSQIRQNPKALLIQNPEGNTFLHELTEQGHKELAIQLAKLNSYDIKIENGYIKFLYDFPGFLNYSDIKIAEKSIQNSAEIEFDEIEMQFTDTFGEALGEENQLPEEQPLLKNQNLHLQPSPTLPTPQEIKQQKQESSIHEDQKNLNEELLQATGDNRFVAELQKEENKKNHTEIITPLTPITIREKDKDGNTRIHQLIKSKKATELKKFIEENTEILKATPIIDNFESVPAICLRNDRGENPLHMMLLDLDTWGDELIIQIAKLHPGMIHVEDNFGIIPFDLTQPKSNLEKAFIELDPLANNFGKVRKIDIEEDNQNNKKGKEPIQEIRRRKGPNEKIKPLYKQDLLDNLLLDQCKNKNIDSDVVKNLIGRGANPKAKDENDTSATTYALKAQNGREALKILHKQKDSTTDIEYAIQTKSSKLQKHFEERKEKKSSLPAYTALGLVIGGTLGAAGCFMMAYTYASSWAFPPLGVALTIIGGCIALGFITRAVFSKIPTDSTTPFLEKTEKDNNNETGNKKQGKTIVVSDKTPESSQSSTALCL